MFGLQFTAENLQWRRCPNHVQQNTPILCWAEPDIL